MINCLVKSFQATVQRYSNYRRESYQISTFVELELANIWLFFFFLIKLFLTNPIILSGQSQFMMYNLDI